MIYVILNHISLVAEIKWITPLSFCRLSDSLCSLRFFGGFRPAGLSLCELLQLSLWDVITIQVDRLNLSFRYIIEDALRGYLQPVCGFGGIDVSPPVDLNFISHFVVCLNKP